MTKSLATVMMLAVSATVLTFALAWDDCSITGCTGYSFCSSFNQKTQPGYPLPSCSACQEREAIALSQGCTGCQMTCTPTAAPPELCTISGCQGQQGSCPMYNVKKTAVPSCVACYQLKYTAISFGCTGCQAKCAAPGPQGSKLECAAGKCTCVSIANATDTSPSSQAKPAPTGGKCAKQSFPINATWGWDTVCGARQTCYGTCNQPKQTCDLAFGKGLTAMCEQLPNKKACFVAAKKFKAVSHAKAAGAQFDAAQTADCACSNVTKAHPTTTTRATRP